MLIALEVKGNKAQLDVNDFQANIRKYLSCFFILSIVSAIVSIIGHVKLKAIDLCVYVEALQGRIQILILGCEMICLTKKICLEI